MDDGCHASGVQCVFRSRVVNQLGGNILQGWTYEPVQARSLSSDSLGHLPTLSGTSYGLTRSPC